MTPDHAAGCPALADELVGSDAGSMEANRSIFLLGVSPICNSIRLQMIILQVTPEWR
jgi:hypothetical protein